MVGEYCGAEISTRGLPGGVTGGYQVFVGVARGFGGIGSERRSVQSVFSDHLQATVTILCQNSQEKNAKCFFFLNVFGE